MLSKIVDFLCFWDSRSSTRMVNRELNKLLREEELSNHSTPNGSRHYSAIDNLFDLKGQERAEMARMEAFKAINTLYNTINRKLIKKYKRWKLRSE